MLVGDGLRDGEAQAQTARFTRPRGIDPVEPVEQMRQMFGVYARPTICDLGLPARRRALYTRADVSAGGRVLQGIVQQVQE